eukprot:scaffold1255_cov225-Skeletonema_dohrnii-CCMP3373.AAC.1
MANYFGSLEAVYCHTHRARYDMVSESAACHPKLGLMRSPTTMQRRQYVQEELELYNTFFVTRFTNYNRPLQAVDCHTHRAR